MNFHFGVFHFKLLLQAITVFILWAKKKTCTLSSRPCICYIITIYIYLTICYCWTELLPSVFLTLKTRGLHCLFFVHFNRGTLPIPMIKVKLQAHLSACKWEVEKIGAKWISSNQCGYIILHNLVIISLWPSVNIQKIWNKFPPREICFPVS